MSYTIDVYRRRMEPTQDWISFFSFTSLLSATGGCPLNERFICYRNSINIEHSIMPEPRMDCVSCFGAYSKRWVVADNLAPFVDDIFTRYEQYSGATLAMGTLFFAIQIYCDFSGLFGNLQSARRGCLVSISCEILPIRISRATWENFGGAAYLALQLVSRLSLLSVGGSNKHFASAAFIELADYFCCFRFLAWSELDLHCMGLLERLLLHFLSCCRSGTSNTPILWRRDAGSLRCAKCCKWERPSLSRCLPGSFFAPLRLPMRLKF